LIGLHLILVESYLGCSTGEAMKLGYLSRLGDRLLLDQLGVEKLHRSWSKLTGEDLFRFLARAFGLIGNEKTVHRKKLAVALPRILGLNVSTG